MAGLKAKYDAEGNRIAKGDIKYFWDHRNRLVKVETPQETIEYTYDYQNRLVKRSAGKNNTHFIHDGWQIVRQFENGKPVKRFLWGTKQDELLCENDNWTLGDHLNTIREVVNSDGKVIAHCDYNAFGKRLNPSSDTLQFAYTGKLTDSATNLQWNINRWYDANVGKWISEDPIGFKGKDENLYRYVHNNSVCLLDFNGLVWYKPWTWFSDETNKKIVNIAEALYTGAEYAVPGSEFTSALKCFQDCTTLGLIIKYARQKQGTDGKFDLDNKEYQRWERVIKSIQNERAKLRC